MLKEVQNPISSFRLQNDSSEAILQKASRLSINDSVFTLEIEVLISISMKYPCSCSTPEFIHSRKGCIIPRNSSIPRERIFQYKLLSMLVFFNPHVALVKSIWFFLINFAKEVRLGKGGQCYLEGALQEGFLSFGFQDLLPYFFLYFVTC